jgi:hypothetical protein
VSSRAQPGGLWRGSPPTDAPTARWPALGDVVDEAHLHGVLARLQAVGLQVLSLRSLPE